MFRVYIQPQKNQDEALRNAKHGRACSSGDEDVKSRHADQFTKTMAYSFVSISSIPQNSDNTEHQLVWRWIHATISNRLPFISPFGLDMARDRLEYQ